MAYITMADARMRQIFEKAASHLRARGHSVDITIRAQEVLQQMETQPPDVLVFSSALHDLSGWQLRDELHTRYANMQTKLIWIASLRSDGVPAVSWGLTDISTFLPFPCSEWVIVLAVEQLLYRTVLSPSPQSESNDAS